MEHILHIQTLCVDLIKGQKNDETHQQGWNRKAATAPFLHHQFLPVVIILLIRPCNIGYWKRQPAGNVLQPFSHPPRHPGSFHAKNWQFVWWLPYIVEQTGT